MSSEIKKNENIKSCIILCGGKSSRMGRDKGSMIIQDKPMIKHILSTLNHQINEAIIVLNNQDRIDKYCKFINPKDYTYTITFVEDEIKDKTHGFGSRCIDEGDKASGKCVNCGKDAKHVVYWGKSY